MTTTPSKEFQVFFGKSLTFQVCLNPKRDNWKASGGVGHAILKYVGTLEEKANVKFHFWLGSDAKQHALANDFSTNSQKRAEQENDFSTNSQKRAEPELHFSSTVVGQPVVV